MNSVIEEIYILFFKSQFFISNVGCTNGYSIEMQSKIRSSKYLFFL